MRQFVDGDGLVHMRRWNDYIKEYEWPPGHVDARRRHVQPAPDDTVPTCFTCLAYRWLSWP